MAGPGAGAVRDGRDPHQRLIPRCAVRPTQASPRPQESVGAVKHSILIACWHMLSTGEMHVDLGSDYFRKRNPERITNVTAALLPEQRAHR